MAQLTSEETVFCKHVTALAFCNQFSDERLPLIEAILGEDYLPAGNRWHWQWSGAGVDDPSLQKAAIIMAATPAMSIYPVLAQRYGQEEQAATAMLLMTAMSFFTISGLLYLL